jgi:hypothetical protein
MDDKVMREAERAMSDKSYPPEQQSVIIEGRLPVLVVQGALEGKVSYSNHLKSHNNHIVVLLAPIVAP